MRYARRPNTAPRDEQGAALVEFALTSLVLYLLLAGTVEFGRIMIAANALQDVARAAARELSVAPVRANVTFDEALTCDPAADPTTCLVDLRRRVYDPGCLVIDLSDPAVAADPDGYFAALPVVNRMMRTLMITEPERPNLLRYPGTLLTSADAAACSAAGPNGSAAATGYTVGIPMIETSGTGELIVWVPVVQEIRGASDLGCPERGPFALVYLPDQDYCGPLASDPVPTRGLAAVRINYPYQAAMLSGYRRPVPTATDPIPPNLGTPILADGAPIPEFNVAPGSPVDDGTTVGAYAGPYGLGRHYALAGQVLRPFRKLISAQAVFRREVFQ